MTSELVSNHIRSKIDKVNVNNPKANWGARVLKELGFDTGMVEDYVFSTIHNMQMHFNQNSPGNPSGSTGLTALSMSIGTFLLNDLEYEGKGKKQAVDSIRIGDLFLEPFVKHGFIKLVPPVSRDTMYTVEVTELWPTIGYDIEAVNIKHVFDEPITDGCLIKGQGVKSLQEAPWRRAATKLMSVPWEINKPVYEALRANQDMFVDYTPVEQVDDYTKLQETRRLSKLVDFKITMTKAEKLLGRVFYKNVEADYRGRLYYSEAFLNFQGSDWSRGMLQFAEAKLMDDAGMWWLAVHTASSYNQSYDIDEIPEWCEGDYRSHLESEGLDSISVDKMTLEDRVRWTNENMEVIVLAGRERVFLHEAEKPVSFLACCIEWFDIDTARGDGRDHYSRLPISIDGSNNGWQHLGAMSKDEHTGKLVGLVAQEIQSDFYVQTAKELLKINDPKLNAMPMKHVRKGVSKRGSMTRAYSAGAGKIGENMWFDCRSEDFHEKYDVEEKDCKRWANELVKAINVVCPGPLQTMEYMQQLASYEIGTYKKYRDGKPAGSLYFDLRKELNELYSMDSEERDTDRMEELYEELSKFESVLVEGNGERRIRWRTPSGFPVVYESFRQDDFKCRGSINGKQIKHTIKIKTNIPDIRGYMCGISPNYVHSMDASHMALVIDRWDGHFGAVHDSFSTHACDVDAMLDLTKDTFIEMYDVDNYFDKIREDITGSTDNIEQPKRGGLDVQETRHSDYFFA